MVNKSEIELGEWLGNSPLGKDIVKKKYFAEGETFNDLIERYSNGNEEVKRLFLEKKFIFGGRIIANRGLYKNGIKSTYSNCYVLSVDDSIESIYECQKNMARTYSYGGGVGIDISKLRPKGSVVHNSARTTSGAVSFMKSFDVVTGTIGQNGRRGALMISMDINHPEIESFVDIKANTTEITNANISVRMNDEFMKAVEKREDYYLRWPCDLKTIPEDVKEEIEKFEPLKSNYEKLAKKYKDNPNLEKDEAFLKLEKEVKPYLDHYGCVTREIDGQTCTYKKVNAYKLFMHLAENNWDYGEPGILFWNKITNWHMMSENKDFQYAGVNPCAEEPLPNGGACLLGSMNIAAYVEDHKFNFDEFRQDCKYATIALNEILDEGWKLHPLAIQKTTVNKYKQIGLGLFDLAGAFIKLGIRYGSDESLEMAQAITHTMLIAAFEESCDLNKENIVYDNLLESDFYKNRIEPFIGEEYKGRYPRNSQLLTIAPTGTISTMVNASSGGAEPMYATYYTRSTKSIGEKDYYIYPQAVLDYYNNDIDSIDVNKLPDFFISADKLNWKERVNMQSVLQQNIDASISSTINLPESATIKDVFDIYFYAWQKGLKGITVFRENCKRVGILNRGTKKEEEQQFQPINAMKRPKILPADFYQVKSNGETFLVLVGLMKDRPYEIFALPYNGTDITFKKDNETKTMNDNTFIKIEGHRGEITKVKKRHYSFDSDLIHIDNIAIDTDEEHSILSEVDNIKENIENLIEGQNGVVKGKILTIKDIDYIFNCLQNIITYYTNDSFRDITLHVSMTLRHCIEPDFITKIEKKCNPDFLSVPNVIARILGKYTKVKETEERCPVCGEKLIRENGCIHCVSCGWSRCE